MIVEAIMNVPYLILVGILKLFPTFPRVNTDGLDGVFRALSLVDRFVSLKVLGSCILIATVMLNAQLIWSVIMWVIRKIPGIQ